MMKSLFTLLVASLISIAFARYGIESTLFHQFFAQAAQYARYVILLCIGIAVLGVVFRWGESDSSDKPGWSYPIGLQTIGASVPLAAAICSALLVVFIAWTSAYPNYNYLGGLIPWSGANGYYFGAEHVLHTGTLDSWNERRPINALLFSVRLMLFDHNFRWTLLGQAALVGVACYLAAAAIRTYFGRSAGLLMFMLLLGSVYLYIPTTLSEPLGFTFGAIAFSLLLYSVNEANRPLFLLGLFLLGLGMLARPGAMLVLPAVILFGAYAFRGERKYSPTMLVVGVASVLAAFALNQFALLLYASGESVPVGNFSTVVYGLVSGGKGWAQVFVDYPQLELIPESERAGFIYMKALERFIAEPTLVVRVYLYGLLHIPPYFVEQLVGVVGYQMEERPKGIWPVLAIGLAFLMVGIGRMFLRRRSAPFLQLLLVGLLAVYLSMPIVYWDGGYRVLITTMPFVMAAVVLAVVGLRGRAADWLTDRKLAGIRSAHSARIGAAIGLLTILGMVVGPKLAAALAEAPATPVERSCPAGQRDLIMRIGSDSAFVQILEDADMPGPSLSPNISVRDFVVAHNNEEAERYETLSFPIAIVRGYDVVSRKSEIVIARPGIVGAASGYHHICADSDGGEGYTLWELRTAEKVVLD